MRTADARSRLARVIERVILAENELPCVDINGVVHVAIAEIRCAEQARDICIVGKNMVAEAVRFTCKNSAVFWVNDRTVGVDSVLDLITQISDLCKKFFVVNFHLGENFINISEHNNGEHV